MAFGEWRHTFWLAHLLKSIHSFPYYEGIKIFNCLRPKTLFSFPVCSRAIIRNNSFIFVFWRYVVINGNIDKRILVSHLLKSIQSLRFCQKIKILNCPRSKTLLIFSASSRVKMQYFFHYLYFKDNIVDSCER